MRLVKIGNSQGIIIPKPFIKKAQLQNRELELQLIDNGLLISPVKKARKGWQKATELSQLKMGSEALDADWLDSSLTYDEEIEW